MKKKLLIYFVFVVGLLLWGSVVHAESYVPAFAKVGGTTIVANGEPYPYSFSTNTYPGHQYADVSIEVTYDLIDGTYEQYPYVYVYFKSTAEDITASRISACSSSCFSSTIITQPIGKTTLSGWPAYMYVLVMPVDKIYYNENQNMNYVGDTLRFSTNHNDTRLLEFVNVFISKDTTILNNAYSVGLDINNNSNWNTTNIINNDNTNTQNIINNNSQNTQNIINNQNQNTQSIINNVNDTSSQSQQELTGFLASWNSILPTNGAISNLFLLPVNFLNAFIGSFNSTCQPFNLGNLFGHDIIFPCIDIQSIVGNSLYMAIDLLFSGLMIFTMIKKLILIWYEITSFKTSSIYELYGGGR